MRDLNQLKREYGIANGFAHRMLTAVGQDPEWTWADKLEEFQELKTACAHMEQQLDLYPFYKDLMMDPGGASSVCNNYDEEVTQKEYGYFSRFKKDVATMQMLPATITRMSKCRPKK